MSIALTTPIHSMLLFNAFGSPALRGNATHLGGDPGSLDWYYEHRDKANAMMTKNIHGQDEDLNTALSTFGLVQEIVLIVTSLIGSAANLLILIVITLTRKLHRLPNIFIFNQALIDFWICAVFLPLHIAILARNHPPPGSACSAIGVVIMWIHTASFLGQPAIAYSRFVVHTYNKNQYRKFLGPCVTSLILVTIWLFPLLLVSPAFFDIFTFEYSHKARDCFIRLGKGVEYFLLVKSFILFVGPVFGIFFIYFRVYDFVRSKKALSESAHRKRDVITTRNLFVAFLVCVVCLLPFNVAVLSDRQGDVPSHLFRYHRV